MAIRPPLLNDIVTGICIPFIRGWCFLKAIIAEDKQILDWKRFTGGLISILVAIDVKFIKADSVNMASTNEQGFAHPRIFYRIIKPLHINQSKLRKIYAVFDTLYIVYSINFDLINGHSRTYIDINGDTVLKKNKTN